jgi:catechol 2,3-dioxygenase-like lactoylglutathione lyase family enzyme
MMGTEELHRARASGILACVTKPEAAAPETNPAAFGRPMKVTMHRFIIPTLLLAIAYLPPALAAEIAKPTVDLSIYGHVSSLIWVAKDLDPVLDYYEKLGLKGIKRTGVTEFTGLIYQGKPAPTTAKSAFGHIGGVLLEFIQPVTGTNIYTDFLKRHGDGVLALGFAVKSDQELAQQVAYLRSKGVAVLERTQWKGSNGTGHGVYFDTAPKGGGLTIALYHDPDGPASAGANLSQNDYPFDKITHYAFVVRNVRSVGAYWQSLGFGGVQVDHNVSVNRFYRGQPGKFEMDLGWGRFGDVPFEWVQSTRGPNLYEEYLKGHGEGVHHLGVAVQDMDAAVKMMEAKDAPPVMGGGWDSPESKGRFTYLDTDPHGGVTIELLWDQPMGK